LSAVPAFYDDIAPKLSSDDGFDLMRQIAGWKRLPVLGLEADRFARHCGRTSTARPLLGGILGIGANRAD